MPGRGQRNVPAALRDAWELALHHSDPLIALAAARAVRAHLTEWETQLAREAVDTGATWEAIGQMMGATRQAAWDRFHDEVGDEAASDARSRYEGEVKRLKDQVARLKRGVR